jgi:hypothetical protein
MKAIGSFIPSFFVIGALAGCSSSTSDDDFDQSETSEISEAVYNEAVKDNDTIVMTRGFNDPGLSGMIFFSSIEIWDGFFFKAAFDSYPEPFFGEGFADSETEEKAVTATITAVATDGALCHVRGGPDAQNHGLPQNRFRQRQHERPFHFHKTRHQYFALLLRKIRLV